MERPRPLSGGDPEDERRLVLLAAAGDEAAFAALVARHQGRLRLFLRRACGDAGQADDLAQAAFLKAWRNLGTLREAAAFGGWLRRIGLNLAMDAARRAGPGLDPLDADSGEPRHPAPEHRLDLEAALSALSFPARACVLLHHGEGLTHGEIAAETGMPIGTVKSHLARATAQLRKRLEPWRTDR